MDKELSRRAWKAVGYPPLSDLGPELRREFQEALIEAESFEDLPGKWQAALLESEANTPNLKVIEEDEPEQARTAALRPEVLARRLRVPDRQR